MKDCHPVHNLWITLRTWKARTWKARPHLKVPRGPRLTIDAASATERNGRKHPWVYCNDPDIGMFCKLCQKFGKPPATARGAWTSRGIINWNHATEMLKRHDDSKWHKDGAFAARMAEEASHTGTVLDMHLAASAKQAEEERMRNRYPAQAVKVSLLHGKASTTAYDFFSRPSLIADTKWRHAS
jgi:hypothetical protein